MPTKSNNKKYSNEGQKKKLWFHKTLLLLLVSPNHFILLSYVLHLGRITEQVLLCPFCFLLSTELCGELAFLFTSSCWLFSVGRLSLIWQCQTGREKNFFLELLASRSICTKTFASSSPELYQYKIFFMLQYLLKYIFMYYIWNYIYYSYMKGRWYYIFWDP